MQAKRRFLQTIAWIAIVAFGSTNVLATPITLANSPLVTGIGKTVAPNVFYIFDDSDSMRRDYMPDSVAGDDDDNCFWNFGYNTIYYNPNTTYSPPIQSDGVTSYPDATFTAAYVDGFNHSVRTGSVNGSDTTFPSAQVDLSATTTTHDFSSDVSLSNTAFSTSSGSKTITVSRNSHGLSTGDVVRFTGTPNWGNLRGIPWSNITYNSSSNSPVFTVTRINSGTFTFTQATSATSSGTGGQNGNEFSRYLSSTTTGDFFYYRYTANPTSPPSTCSSDGNYTRVEMYNQSTAQKQNFANWFSYYRTRLLMMKTASGRAFAGLTDQYRVGFTVTSETGTAAGKFLGVSKFNSTQRTSWYNTLYGIDDGDTFLGTPLRGALSKAGRYFAGTLPNALAGTTADPVQYSCQQNFTILATDGFWNTFGETTSGFGTKYGPYRQNNSTLVGDQDSGAGSVTPYRDGASGSTIISRENTLADVAMYYYKTDLRPTVGDGGLTDEGEHIDVSTNNVPTTSSDSATHQHMTTYTMGLGVSDQLTYPSDYANILAGSKNWPDPSVTNTGVTVSGRVDDLWHAGINGRGSYLSAKDPTTVVAELSRALQSIRAVVGSSSAAATSNLQPVSGDNTAFIARFKTVDWTGDVVARNIDVVTGAIPSTDAWSAQSVLDARLTPRNIYTYSSSTTNHLRAFTYANMGPELGYFQSSALPQYAPWSTDKKNAATAEALINYLRGEKTNEDTGAGNATDLFRKREHVLGDIVSAAPVFVRKPPFAYTDPGYATFYSNQSSRVPTVYVGANDGMLHAFDGSPTGPSAGGTGGTERWAYIPSMVLPNLSKLAASDYSINHRFYVDGPITVGDAYSSTYTGTPTGWATILVGGLGAGGKGYYALDVTDPNNPKALWEFTDANMGHSYGNPIITKREDGDGNPTNDQWVVIFASGYNNGGDQKGHLFVVDAFTGTKLSGALGDIPTGTSADESLSGIARISNYVEDGLKNNITRYVYGGDLSGALWRFDITTGTKQKLGDTSSTPGAQPITVQPELAKINNHIVVYFGTGRYLGPSDLTEEPYTSTAQAIYAVKDTLGSTSLGVLTGGTANLVSQNLSYPLTSPRTSTNNTVDWSTNNGWYVTVPVGERFNVDPGLQLGTLVIAANKPETDYCQPTGSSVLYQINYKSGFVLATNEFQAQIVGNTQLQLGGSGSGGSVVGGKVVIESVLADGTTVNTDQVNAGGAAGSAIRVNWREIE